MPASRLVPALNLGTMLGLPSWSAAPTGDPAKIAAALLQAGYRGVQGTDDPAYARAGLVTYGSGRVVAPDEAYELLLKQQQAGHACSTLHVGTGFESDREALRLVEAILAACARLGHPAHIETHRATITQDIWRTMGWIERLPEMTFNADLSHWYTGLEMPYGDFAAKLAFMQPFFDRVRFIHGRIGSGGAIQIAVGVGGHDEPHASRFSQMWQHCFAGFLANAPAGESIVFAPELLPESVETPDGPLFIDYALTTRSSDGAFSETSDRWEQGLRLTEMAKSAFAAASTQPA